MNHYHFFMKTSVHLKINFPTSISIVDVIYSCLFSKEMCLLSMKNPIHFLLSPFLLKFLPNWSCSSEESNSSQPYLETNLMQIYINSGSFSKSHTHRRYFNVRQSNATDFNLKNHALTNLCPFQMSNFYSISLYLLWSYKLYTIFCKPHIYSFTLRLPF